MIVRYHGRRTITTKNAVSVPITNVGMIGGKSPQPANWTDQPTLAIIHNNKTRVTQSYVGANEAKPFRKLPESDIPGLVSLVC